MGVDAHVKDRKSVARAQQQQAARALSGHGLQPAVMGAGRCSSREAEQGQQAGGQAVG